MVYYFELWDDVTNSMIDEFDMLAEVLDEVRWRVSLRGEDEALTLTILQRNGDSDIEAVMHGDELLRRVREITVAAD